MFQYILKTSNIEGTTRTGGNNGGQGLIRRPIHIVENSVGGSFIPLFFVMYPINLLESSGRIRKLVSQSKAGIMPLKQNHIPQDEQSYNTIVTCKWALRQVVDFRLEISSLNLTNTLPFKNFTAKEMNNLVIKNMKVVPCVGSKFVQTARVLFNQVSF